MQDIRDEEEDDSPYNPKVYKLLEAKVALDNGGEGYVFTRNTDENPRGKYRCHVCNVQIGCTKSLQQHANGKNHTRNMQTLFHLHNNFSKVVNRDSSKLCTGVDIPELAPGEPVPPGFEDIVKRVPEITPTLEAMKAPLIGLEYLAEITPVGDEVEPKYCCLLCNKRGDPRTVLAHLVCFNHRIKYIGSYFPKTNMALALIPKVKEYKRGTGEVLAKIARAIETKFGRLNPVIVDGAVFDENKEEYYRGMRAGKHFHETPDSDFEKLVDLEFIKKCVPESDTVLTIDMEKDEAKKRSTALKNEMNRKRNRNLADEEKKPPYEKKFNTRASLAKENRERSIETISSSRSRSYSRSRSRSRSITLSPTPSKSRSRSRSRSRSNSRSRSRPRPNYRYMYRNYEPRDGRSRSPRYYCRSRTRSRSRSRSRGSNYRRYRSSNYRKTSPIYARSSFRTIRYDSLYKDEDDYAPSEKPKSTQSKVAELRDKRRKKDLFADYVEKLEKEMTKTLKNYKKNPEKHPLYPEEWKKFWNRRYKELTAEGVDASKHDFKPEWIKFWLVRMKELHNEELEMKKAKYRAELGLTENENSLDSDVIEVSPTPLEDDKSSVTVEDIKNTWKALTGSEIKGGKEKSPEKLGRYEWGSVKSEEPEQPVRVITVLRLLTALESQLGSLGPRVNNLLAQAIALEKKKPNSSDSLIDVSENNVLFETVKEKLKGQLFAGIVQKHMVNATRTAIQNVAELFNTWKLQKQNPEPVAPATAIPVSIPVGTPATTSEPLIVPGIGAVDKLAIAQQIAAALVAQGKTNVTEQELEQLISAVVGMAQATTRQIPTAPVTSSGYYPTSASQTVSPVITPTSFSSGVLSAQREVETGSKSTILQQLTTSASSKTNWNSISSSLKTLQSYDDDLSSKIRKGLLSKEGGELSEEDMKALVQNFKDLPPEDQQSIIAYLKELESEDPESVEKLRKFVSYTGENFGRNDMKAKEEAQASDRLSPFSMREGGANPSIEDGSKMYSNDLDDDEDDYSYEEIYRAAEKKVSGKSVVEKMIEEQQKKAKLSQSQSSPQRERTFEDSKSKNSDDPEKVLSEAKVMIANIMGQLPSKYGTGGVTRNLGSRGSSNPRTPADTAPMSNYSSQSSSYDSTPANTSVSKSSNNLLNDYNYQDDIFGYSNDSFPNYQTGSESYQADVNSNDGYSDRQQQQQQQAPGYAGGYPNPEQSYNACNYETWNDGYSQYPPVQPTGYGCPPPHGVPMMNVNYSGPPGPYQGSPSNDYGGPSLYNNSYREYY